MDADPRPYPPWWIARANERRGLLDAAVERLRAVLGSGQGLLGALVFGSYATGRVGPDSDLDLIVVTSRAANGDPGRRHADIAKELALGVPCDLIVYDLDEFERRSASGFVAQARRNGLWIDATTPA